MSRFLALFKQNSNEQDMLHVINLIGVNGGQIMQSWGGSAIIGEASPELQSELVNVPGLTLFNNVQQPDIHFLDINETATDLAGGWLLAQAPDFQNAWNNFWNGNSRLSILKSPISFVARYVSKTASGARIPKRRNNQPSTTPGSASFAVLAIDYRGFGLSTDELPSEDAVYEDARAAWAWLGREHPGRDRYLFGHSLGGAIAIELARQGVAAKGLIVEGTFT